MRGNFAIWIGERGDEFTGQVILFRCDLLSGTNIEIADHGVGNRFDDVAANGDVVFWTNANSANYNIVRYRGNYHPSHERHRAVEHIPDHRWDECHLPKEPPSGQVFAIMMYGATVNLTLALPRSQRIEPGTDYAASNEWVAFTQPGTGGELQVWVRSPAGLKEQVSFFGSSSQIDALNPDGMVMFVNKGLR